MMQAVKEDWWRLPDGIPYYPITRHWAGHSGKGDTYTVRATAAFTKSYGIMLQRTLADGTIRETDQSNSIKWYDFYEDDILHSTIPPNQLKKLAIRYHRVKGFAIDLNIEAPNIEYIRMRGNWAELGHWDLSNLRKLNYFDIAMNFIHTLNLPVTGPDDVDNNFYYAYAGFYRSSNNNSNENRPRPAEYENEAAPRQVINTLMRRAYYSNISDTTVFDPSNTEYKNFNTDSNVGTLYYDNINYHNELCKKGWQVKHISTVENVDFSSSNAGTAILEFLTTYHNWDIIIPADADWLTADQYSGLYVQADVNGEYNPTQVTLSATANTTGAPRSTVIEVRKIKEYPRTTGKEIEDKTEFHYSAKVTITQP